MRGQGGFSVIEMLISIGIMVVLAGLILSSLSSARESARDVHRLSDVRQLTNGLAAWHSDHGDFPCKHISKSDDADFMQPFVDEGYLVGDTVKDPIGGAYVYEYATFKTEELGECGQIAYLGFYTENSDDCPSFGKYVGGQHCHIFYPNPIPSPCTDPYHETMACDNWHDNSSDDDW